jgi:oxygen-independent coproporphyrinogen-3 oxidase
VSNFAFKGFESIHNNSYWQYKDYLGFGPSAHSFVNGERKWNYSSLKFYIDAVNKRSTGLRGSELLSQKQMLEEYVMLAFRSGGLNLDELNAKFGSKWIEKNENNLNKFIDSGFIKRVDNFFSLTKKGYTLCDEIISKFV